MVNIYNLRWLSTSSNQLYALWTKTKIPWRNSVSRPQYQLAPECPDPLLSSLCNCLQDLVLRISLCRSVTLTDPNCNCTHRCPWSPFYRQKPELRSGRVAFKLTPPGSKAMAWWGHTNRIFISLWNVLTFTSGTLPLCRLSYCWLLLLDPLMVYIESNFFTDLIRNLTTSDFSFPRRRNSIHGP